MKTNSQNVSNVQALKTPVVHVTHFKHGSKRKPIGKAFDLVEGKAQARARDALGSFYNGTSEIVQIYSMRDLRKFMLKEGDPVADFLTYGLAEEDFNRVVTDAERSKQNNEGAIARTEEYFSFQKGEPCVLFLDYDPEGAPHVLSLDDYDAMLCKHVPSWKDREALYIGSASSGIYYEDSDDGAKNSAGLHAYTVLADASRCADIGRAIFRDLVEGGEGWINISERGTRMLRCPVDAAVWQGSRQDYAFGSACGEGLVQRRDSMVVDGEAVWSPSKSYGLGKDDFLDWQHNSPVVRQLMDDAADAAEDIRAAYVEKNAQKAHSERGVPLDVARRTYEDAACHGVLGPDFEVVDTKGRVHTIAELLDDPERFDGLRLRDPAEPDYRGGAQTAIAYLVDGDPVIYSQAHGGILYLLRTEDENCLAAMAKYAAAMARFPGVSPTSEVVGREKLQPGRPHDDLIAELPVRIREKLNNTDGDLKKDCYGVQMFMLQRGFTPGEVKTVLERAPCAAELVDDGKLDGEVRRVAGKHVLRQAQRRESAELGAEPIENPLPSVVTLDQMIDDFVYLKVGQYVGRKSSARVLSYGDMAADLSGSKTVITPQKGDPKEVPTIGLWRARLDRWTVAVPTWGPGRPQFCRAPAGGGLGGDEAFNTWRGLPDYAAPKNWRELVAPFLDHIAYLVPVEAERARFLQWLAHMFQKPGELAHTYYCMIATTHGIGRNWMSCVFTRALRGYVAASVDMNAVFKSDFNGVLAQKLLAIVDEAHEGMDEKKYERGKTLRRMITEEHRLINPKCDRQHTEYNACRWLFYSNYEDALPFDNEYRRGIFIENPKEAKPARYYTGIYKLLGDPQFIASVGKFFQTLDIRDFNPGAAAPWNEMKLRSLDAMTSEVEKLVTEFKDAWPGPWALNSHVTEFVVAGLPDGQKVSGPHLQHALRNAGFISTDKVVTMNSAEATGRRGSQASFQQGAKRSRVSLLDKTINVASVKKWRASDIVEWAEHWNEWLWSDRKTKPEMPEGF